MLAPSGNLEKYVNLSLGKHTYSGNKELTQYFIRLPNTSFIVTPPNRDTSMEMGKDNSSLSVKVCIAYYLKASSGLLRLSWVGVCLVSS